MQLVLSQHRLSGWLCNLSFYLVDSEVVDATCSLNFVFLILGSLGLPSSIKLDVIIIRFVAYKIRSSSSALAMRQVYSLMPSWLQLKLRRDIVANLP